MSIENKKLQQLHKLKLGNQLEKKNYTRICNSMLDENIKASPASLHSVTTAYDRYFLHQEEKL